MTALLRRQPQFAFFAIAFAWTWTFVIVFLILFPLPDVIVRTTPGDFGPLIGAVVVTAAVAGRAGLRQVLRGVRPGRGAGGRGRVGVPGGSPRPSTADAPCPRRRPS